MLRLCMTRRQNVQVSYQKETLVRVLQTRPILQGPDQVTDMTWPGWTMTSENAFFRHKELFSENERSDLWDEDRARIILRIKPACR